MYSPPDDVLEIGKITPTGTITEYPLITSFGQLTSGGGLTTGQDGKLYFTENNQIGQVTLNPSGGSPTFVQIQNPNAGTVISNSVEDITTGPDGNLWYTQPSSIVPSFCVFRASATGSYWTVLSLPVVCLTGGSGCAYRLCHPNVVPMETAEPSD